ncbi:hypothetical protein RNS23_03110 [Staphylococcus pseudintermedius]|uniref:hypothetical protein n=1 Tax=Staphylococcus pseudintermedius TaxID=283734 RepID=UPI001DE81C84|nr:hypothetical protein [Staphylococcus pseudintermedius]EIA5045350.1 hypothetical protein [Staphylococcus pseudintermedius]EKN5171418.1 hypothetical protein [Staphylococcus pseudintermedius]MCE5639778.1 hypothetical protein [Staphylococcus pseudintermedius]MDK3807139.1 hypothetical protein [Staphylococcus pseudintermedius]MDK4085651.1 hypothetical protein [Staphylococcus pseudintermedius]
MKIYIKNHGDFIGEWIDKINLEKRDLKYLNDEELEEYDYRPQYVGKGIINFVGIIYEEGNLFVSFPKNFEVSDERKDIVLLYEVLKKFQKQNNKKSLLSDRNNYEIQSNYPFNAFENIYNYFKAHGLIIRHDNRTNKRNKGKLNWKATIQKSNLFISKNKVTLFPYYFDNKSYESDFLNECMIFCIDYTINEFKYLINREPTGLKIEDFDFFNMRKKVISKLKNIRMTTFKNNEIYLIDNLISFFSEFNYKASFKLQHYYFHNVWEKMVAFYLNAYYDTIRDNKLVFSIERLDKYSFNKRNFYPNSANKFHNIQPDYYYREKNYQLIFDAKYKKNLRNIDYKQLMYHVLLEEYDTFDIKNFKTYSALILPSKYDYQDIHFKMSKLFSKKHNDLIVSEVYLNIKKVMRSYLMG